ncbi:hypothetical protein, partial [Bifidobacterium ramosum]|uniref:hypothetical protein n=1 Tax=Bifidobacterium ramosum TaxID=1798158 RepID=UPI001953DA4A
YLPLTGITHMTNDETVAENLLTLQRDSCHARGMLDRSVPDIAFVFAHIAIRPARPAYPRDWAPPRHIVGLT